ncbi:AAA family ATPase ['Camptotheca acuminata' phytoplasma]|uniref:AAA family ATPase n=1 Tax='Camptotheca acuminata' phytoplasma TaxID=3239192 RepID=UPI00351A64D2
MNLYYKKISPSFIVLYLLFFGFLLLGFISKPLVYAENAIENNRLQLDDTFKNKQKEYREQKITEFVQSVKNAWSEYKTKHQQINDNLRKLKEYPSIESLNSWLTPLKESLNNQFPSNLSQNYQPYDTALNKIEQNPNIDQKLTLLQELLPQIKTFFETYEEEFRKITSLLIQHVKPSNSQLFDKYTQNLITSTENPETSLKNTIISLNKENIFSKPDLQDKKEKILNLLKSSENQTLFDKYKILEKIDHFELTGGADSYNMKIIQYLNLKLPGRTFSLSLLTATNPVYNNSAPSSEGKINFNKKLDSSLEGLVAVFIPEGQNNTYTSPPSLEKLLTETLGSKKVFCFWKKLKRKSTLGDVKGNDAAVNELRKIKTYIQEPSKYEELEIDFSKGILLYVPPGTGKTFLAQAFANELNIPNFIDKSGSDFAVKYSGEGAQKSKRIISTSS